jgi:PAS domain S-box-containing protein
MTANMGPRDVAEKSALETEVLFRQIAESIHEVFWLTDPLKSRLLYISPAYETVWGRDVDSLYRDPQSFLEAIHPDDRVRVVQALEKQVNGGYDEEYRVVHPDGTVRWVRDRAFPIRDEAGRVYRVTGVATDITERVLAQQKIRSLNQELEQRIAQRTDELLQTNTLLGAEVAEHKKTERALRESSERLSRMIGAAPEAVVVIDAQGVVEEWNPQAERTFGWTRSEALGRKLSQLIVPARSRDAHSNGITRYLATRKARILNKTIELDALHRDGHEFPVELSVWPVQSGQSLVFGAFIRDISTRKHEEHGLERRTVRKLQFRDALYELSRLNKTDFDAALARILEVDARTLGVERVSYWSLSGQPVSSERVMMYLKGRDCIVAEAGGLSFDAARYPRYFAALGSQTPVVAHRAQEDPATCEFAESYLKPYGVTSMLDVGVWFQGRMTGVVCHAHVGEPREWLAEEIEFASSIAAMISLALEASQRYALTTALRESEEKYRLVVENANEAIIVTQDGFFRFANPMAIAMSGYSEAEYYALPLLELVHPEDRDRIAADHRQRIAGEKAESNYPFRIITKQGEVRWLQINSVLIDWGGRPGTLNFLSDITERHRLQEDLKQTLIEREAILQSSVVGIVFTKDRVIKWINHTLEQHMLGYHEGELVGRTTEVFYPSRDSFERYGDDAYGEIGAGRTCLGCRDADAAPRWLAVLVSRDRQGNESA